jgi:hypothetical protein
MADPLPWNAGEGYDIHVLRGGPSSKSLVGALKLPAGSVPASLSFSPQVQGPSSNFGVGVNQSTGEVTATPPPANSSRIEINNFLMTVSIQDNTSKKYETEIRVHVHDAITDIWLTPPTLTIHKDADECRFTVLAAFNDGTVGDITDWSLLTYQSRDPNTNAASTDVLVSANGVLQTVTPGKTANIIVSLIPPLFSTSALTLTATAQAIAKESWSDIGAKTEVTYVADKLMLEKEDKDKPQKGGTVVPNKSDPQSGNRDSVVSVVENALNILFVAEGFSQKRDFDYLVSKVVTDLRTNAHLQPFNLVKNSINFWSVFLPSQSDGISLLGDHTVAPLPKDSSKWHGDLVPLPKKPAATATSWSLEEMIHQVGLPVATDPATLDSVKDLWGLRYGTKDYQHLAATNFKGWRDLAAQPAAWRSVLNEIDSPFGIRNYDRPRATPSLSEVDLGSDPRRTKDVSFQKFIANLNYGKGPGGSTYNLGPRWKDAQLEKDRGPDWGFLCFLCRTEKHGGVNWGSNFLSSTGRTNDVYLQPNAISGGAQSVDIATPPISAREELLFSAVVAHEFGHRLGLGDEYGEKNGTGIIDNSNHAAGNLQAKKDITTTSTSTPPRTVYDKTLDMKWLWPRVTRAGSLKGTGSPQKTGNSVKVTLQTDHGKPFVFQDIVRFRQAPVKGPPSKDPVANFGGGLYLVVTAHTSDSVSVALGHGGSGGLILDIDAPIPGSSSSQSWSDQFIALFKPQTTYTVVCPLRVPGLGSGTELHLLSEVIRNRIARQRQPGQGPSTPLAD